MTRILLLLGASVGLPYFLLASTSPLLQAWFARARPGENPYRLFAVSNLASLVALVGYPFVVEPFLGGASRWALWSWLFAGVRGPLRRGGLADAADASTRGRDRGRSAAAQKRRTSLWLALSATGSVLLLAVTNHLTQNVASVPLLWLAPLTLYLLSFILTFEGKGWYRPRVAVVACCWRGSASWAGCWSTTTSTSTWRCSSACSCRGCSSAACSATASSTGCGPAPSRLTAFYLTVSAGGALGGLLVAVVAPLVFNGYYELGIGAGGARAARRGALRRTSSRVARCAQPGGAARRRRLRGLRRLPLPAATCASPRAASTACCGSRSTACRARSRTCAAWCTARSCTASSTCTTSSRRHAHHLLPRGLGHRRGDPLASASGRRASA